MMLPKSPMTVPRVSDELASAIKAELAAKVNESDKPRARLINPNETKPPAQPMTNMVAAIARAPKTICHSRPLRSENLPKRSLLKATVSTCAAMRAPAQWGP